MAAPKYEAPPEEAEDWLVTYADAITLLMAFFVMMLTFAEFDIPAFEEAAAAIKANVNDGDQGLTPTQELKLEVEDVIYEMEADQAVTVETDSKGLVISLAGGSFFKNGTADLTDVAIPFLEKIVLSISSPKYRMYNIPVEGHTDDDPISTKRFPSNWELSSQRASTVVRYMASQGMDTLRMTAVGYADTRPKVPNRDLEGKRIRENQETNRRVSIRVFPMNLSDRQDYLKRLDKVDAQKRIKQAQAAKIKAAEDAAAQATVPQPAN